MFYSLVIWDQVAEHAVESFLLRTICLGSSKLLWLFDRLSKVLQHNVRGAIERKLTLSQQQEPSALDAIQYVVPKPILFMHGTADQVAPLWQSERMHYRAELYARESDAITTGESLPSSELWTVDGGRHGELLSSNRSHYIAKVSALIEQVAAF